MCFQSGFFSMLVRGLVVLAVALASLIQPEVAQAEPDAPPPLTPILLRDIDTTGANSIDPKCRFGLGPLGPITLFAANDGVNGCALWKSDGSDAGTMKVKTILPIAGAVATLYNALYFTADDGVHGPQLWRSDGSEGGTYRVASVKPDVDLVSLAGAIYFFVDGGARNWQLWRSDGTLSGTSMVWSFQFDNDAKPYSLVAMNGKLYYLMSTEVGYGKFELWTSDGTTKGTRLTVNLPGGVYNNLSVANNTLFFSMSIADDYNGSNVWRSDGTPQGTYAIRTTDGNRAIHYSNAYTPFNGQMYFVSYQYTNEYSWALYRTDGTKTGASLVFTSSYQIPNRLNAAGSALYFLGTYGDSSNYELKRVDVTSSGMVRVVGIPPPNPGENYEVFGGYGTMTGLNDGRLVFGRKGQWWVTDGTVTGTFGLGAGQPYVSWLTPQTNLIYAAIYDAVNGSELWKTDGTAAGTKLVKDINPSTNDSLVNQLTAVNGSLFFRASVAPNQPTWWQSNGTALGTQQVITFSALANELTTSGPWLYYADGGIWRTDGSPTGTLRVTPDGVGAGGIACVYKGGCYIGPAEITRAGQNVFFNARSNLGNQLWRSDGTLTGTLPLITFQSSIGDSLVHYPTAITDTVLFFAQFSSMGLWRSDGTIAGVGTQFIREVSWPSNVRVVVGSTLFWKDSFYSAMLWKSDGTYEGTVTVQMPASIARLESVNSKLIFSSNDGKLWRTDGTFEGTQELGSFDPSLSDGRWFSAGNRLFMTQTVSAQLGSLITTDGTAADTRRLLDYSTASPVRYVAAYGDGYLFVMGNELWATDGTTGGTHKLLQLLPSQSMSTNANNYLLVGNTLYFEASYGGTGYELWALTLSDAPDVRLSLPARVFVSPTNPASVAVDITNFGAGTAQSATLTATLGLSLTYVSDTSGITPTVQGNTLVWALPNLASLSRQAFNLSVRLPNSSIGSRYPITFTLGTSTPASQDKTVEVVAGVALHLPLVFR